MRNFIVIAIVALSVAAPVKASQVGWLAFGSFQVESLGIGSSGPVVVSGRQGHDGIESFEVSAFGKRYTLSERHTSKLQGRLFNGLQFSYEGGYEELGGRTLYLRFTQGFTADVADEAWITVKENGSIEISDGPM